MKEFSKSSSSNGPKTHKLSIVPQEPIKWYIQSNHPDDFEDLEVEIPSVAAELTYNFKNYSVERNQTNKDYLRIPSYPPSISLIVDTVKGQVPYKNPPGLAPTLTCMISLGIPQILTRRVVKKLAEISNDFRKRTKNGDDLELYVQGFLRSAVDCPVDKANYAIITLTSEVSDEINRISFETGLSRASVAILAIYATLIQQPETPPNYKERYQNCFDSTIRMLECKLDAAKAMIQRLDSRPGDC